MATIQELMNEAAEIRDAELDQENTAFRVGTMLINVIQYLTTLITSEGATAAIDDALADFFVDGSLKQSALPPEFTEALGEWAEGVAEKEASTQLLKLIHSRIILLDSMGSSLDGLDYTPVAGDLVWRTGYVWKYNGSEYESGGIPPKLHVVYLNKHTGKPYMWNGSAMVEVGNHYDDKIQISKMDQTAVSDIPVGKLHYIPSQSKLVYRISNSQTHSWTPRTDLVYIDIANNTLYRWQGSSFQKVLSNAEVINDLTTGGGGAALSAEMGKLLKQNVNAVQANIQKLYNKLANMAFLNAEDKASAAPTPLDWNAPKVSLSVNNYVTPAAGVIITAPQTVEIGASATIIVVPASGYTLGVNAITADIGTVSYDSIADNYTITIANVREALTVNINGTATKGVNVTLINSDGYISLVPLSAQTGKQYTGQLTLSQNAPGTHSLPSQVSWSMGGTTGTSQVDGNGQFTIANVTDDITVTANAAVVHTVAYDLHDAASSNNATTAAGAFSTELTYSNDSNYTGDFYNFAVKVMMGGTEITDSCYSFDPDPTSPKGTINIANVTGSIEIEVYAVVIIKDKGLDSSDRMNFYEIGDSDAESISDWNGAVIESYLPFITGHSYDWRHCWRASRDVDGSSYNDYYKKSLNVYDENKTKLETWTIQGRDITGTGTKAISSASGEFTRFSLRDIDHCYLYDNTSNRFVWKGNVVELNGEEYTYNGPLKKTT